MNIVDKLYHCFTLFLISDQTGYGKKKKKKLLNSISQQYTLKNELDRHHNSVHLINK